jgi:hypothetical protein
MKTSLKIIQWTPRIICILAILFVSMFALDAFDQKFTLWQQLAAFFMHMIPSFILVLFLIVAWRWELIGGLILTAVALGFVPFIYIHNFYMNHSAWMSLGIVLVINFPFILAGSLFVLSHFLRKKNLVTEVQPGSPGA